MKIAFASNDGQSISAHFGHCACFIVLTVEDGQIKSREVRQAANDAGSAPGKHGEKECYCHGDTGQRKRLAVFSDCDAVMALGMGPGAKAALEAQGIKAAILSAPMEAEQAALAYAHGELQERQTAGESCCHGSE